LRILGPETIGIMVPGSGLNATYMHMGVAPGKIAFIGQSGTIASAVIDWSLYRGVGFSHITTLGDGIDVGLDDLIDYLAQDRHTKAILLHIENIAQPRRFMSAVRAISKSKPVIVVKSGRYAEAQWKSQVLPPGITNGDKIYDAVFRRAGVLRVHGADEMFDALETLTRMKPVKQHSLHIISNGFGPSVMAIDRLKFLNGNLGELSSETLDELSKFLPAYWSRRNPIDLDYSADPTTFRKAIDILGKDSNVNNLLVMFAPTLTEDSLQIADAVIDASKTSRLNILACWLGHTTVIEAREAFYHAGIPSYTSPEKAVKAFMHMVNHERSQRVLRETPESYKNLDDDYSKGRKLVTDVYQSGRRYLTHQEAHELLCLYGIPMLETRYAASIEEAEALAAEIEGKVYIRILHEAMCIPFGEKAVGSGRYIEHIKGLDGTAEVREACLTLRAHCQRFYPDSAFMGFAVQPSRQARGGIGFSLGVTRDPVFGPLIVCGASGSRLNVLVDRQVALPPLNLVLARDLLSHSHMYSMLKEYSENPETDINRLCETLVIISQIIVDIPEIKGIEIVPFYFGSKGGIAVSAMIDLGEPTRTTIQPYPKELREWILLPISRRRVELRPVRAEDEPAHVAFHSRLSPESIRYRYFHYRKSFTHDELVQMLHLDYDREMAFIAVSHDETQRVESEGDFATEEVLGTVRAWTDPDNLQCEFAIIISDQMKGERLGWVLMRKIIEYCTDRGTVEMIGSVLADNKPMLKLAEKLGFSIKYDPEEDVMSLRLPLNEPAEWQTEMLRYK
jgi:acetyltransferase